MSKNIAIILAGGAGSRAEQNIPKQFVMVNGKPILVYTLQVFQQSEVIDEICVVTMEDRRQEVQEYSGKYHISKLKYVANAGNSGLESLKNGLSVLNASEKDLIIVHDGVRPFVTSEIIKDNIAIAQEQDVTVTAIPCVETLIKSDNHEHSANMVARDGLYRVQTPQTFRYGCICELFNEVGDLKKVKEPSVFALYMKMNKGPVYIAKGSEKNIKLTYSSDIDYFKEFFA